MFEAEAQSSYLNTKLTSLPMGETRVWSKVITAACSRRMYMTWICTKTSVTAIMVYYEPLHVARGASSSWKAEHDPKRQTVQSETETAKR